MTGPINPLLEDDDDEFVSGANPLLDDDDEYAPAGVDPLEQLEAIGDEAEEPKKPAGRGGSEQRVTANDAAILAHAAKFIIVTPMIASVLLLAERKAYSKATQPKTISHRTARDRLERLVSMELLKAHRVKGVEVIYGITPDGAAAAQRFGYLMNDGEIARKSITSYVGTGRNHDMAISYVAAQYASPTGWQDGDKRRAPVTHADLVSEYAIRRAQKITEIALPTGTKFGEWREREFAAAVQDAESGVIEWSDLMETDTAFWCLGLSKDVPGRGFVSNLKIPDLVISRESRRAGRASGSYAVEVELTKKSESEYERVLRTWAIGFTKPYDYGALIYKTNNREVINLITKVDRKHGFNLIASGRLRFEPILEADGVTQPPFAKKGKES